MYCFMVAANLQLRLVEIRVFLFKDKCFAVAPEQSINTRIGKRISNIEDIQCLRKTDMGIIHTHVEIFKIKTYIYTHSS
jgi:hypothetical protein